MDRGDVERTLKEFDELEEREREYFDRDRVDNPYPDSRILQCDPGMNLLLDRALEPGVEVIEARGFRRVDRRDP